MINITEAYVAIPYIEFCSTNCWWYFGLGLFAAFCVWFSWQMLKLFIMNGFD